jgi:hypothetical protein
MDNMTEQAAQAARASRGADWRLDERLFRRGNSLPCKSAHTDVDIHDETHRDGTPGI